MEKKWDPLYMFAKPNVQFHNIRLVNPEKVNRAFSLYSYSISYVWLYPH